MDIRKKSIKQEKETAKQIQGKTIVGSGCAWNEKGDCKNDNLLVECKTTEKEFYSLHIDTWMKIEKEAISAGLKTPVMRIDLLDGGSQKVSFAVVNERDYDSSTVRAFDPYFDFNDSKLESKKKSFRIHAEDIDYITEIKRTKTPGNYIWHVIVFPWDMFLKNVIERGNAHLWE